VVEYHVRNLADRQFNFVFLHLRQFERDLRIFDENDEQLNFYRNDEVEAMLQAAEEENPTAYESVEEQLDRWEYMIYIQLPPDRPLRPGEMRIVRLEFEESTAVSFDSVLDPSPHEGWVSEWEKKFFNIPSFFADVKRYPDDSHDVFVNVVGSPGYASTGDTRFTRATDEATTGGAATAGDTQDREEVTPSGVYENGVDDTTRTISVRLPPGADDPYEFSLQYDLVPRNGLLMTTLAWYWAIALFAGILLVTVPVLGLLTGAIDVPTAGPVSTIARTSTVGFLSATIGLVFALGADWTDRYRVLCVVPLLLHGMAWVFWNIP